MLSIMLILTFAGTIKSVTELCDDAKKEVENVASGNIFCVRDLFRGHAEIK